MSDVTVRVSYGYDNLRRFARDQPYQFCFTGSQLKPSRCRPSCNVSSTVRQLLPDGVDVADGTADIRLLVIGEEMELDCVTAKHVTDIFSVADEFEWTQDRALWNTAVQSRGCSQNTSVRERRTANGRYSKIGTSLTECQ